MIKKHLFKDSIQNCAQVNDGKNTPGGMSGDDLYLYF